jgi:hypothetical protein
VGSVGFVTHWSYNVVYRANHRAENIHLDCPYFYELKALIGNRTNFTDQALAEAVAQSAKKYAQQDNRKVAEEEDDQSDEEEEAEEPRNTETTFAHPSSSMTAMGESNGVILVHPYPGAPAECIERWVVKQDLFASAEVRTYIPFSVRLGLTELTLDKGSQRLPPSERYHR